MRYIYQHLNSAYYGQTGVCDQIERFALTGTKKLVKDVVFEDNFSGTTVQVHVPYQIAFAYWQSTNKSVCGVTFESADILENAYSGFVSFAQANWNYKGEFTNVTDWRVIVGASHFLALHVKARVPYMQHKELEALKAS